MNKYVPTDIAISVFDIDYTKLYAKGKRIILFDLDNTLISYLETVPSEKTIELGQMLLAIGFNTFVLTNNHGYRINHFMEKFPASGYGSHMQKPSIRKINQFLSKNKIINKSEIVMIGDQLVTDIKCANKLGVDSILIKSISRSSEHFYTKINRLREKFIIKKISKTNPNYAKKIAEIVRKEK